MSNGLPPPDPESCVSPSWPAFEVVAAAVVLVDVATFFLVLVLVVFCSSVVWAAVVEDEAAADALSELSVVSVVFADVECVVLADCVLFAALEVVLGVVVTSTPGLVVGIVTDAAAEDALSTLAEVDFATVEVVVDVAGHNACMISPFITIPNNVFELTETSEQAILTSFAIKFSADWHTDEHPLLKSET